MRRRKLLILFLFAGTSMFAQQAELQVDSLKNVELKTIEVFGEAKRNIETEMKMAVSVDEFLASSEQISFIKRGAYAWEPLLNNMSTERSTITIDGMHVFGACTDKMDPVTSYVESNNLAGIDIKSGQEGGLHGSTVAGNIELKRKQSRFTTAQNGFKGSYQTGFELNNKQFFNLGNVSFSNEKWVADASISYRQAGNYFDGNQKEIKHSQFKKFNTSLGVAYKTSELSSVRLDGIFDMAKDVGFPALPMDLWLSRGLITSVSYKQLFEKSWIRLWDTKLYFNTMEHYMDDTTRPENLVHMDMPGWSTTYGLLSKINLKNDDYSSEIQLNAYKNSSIAEMRMYPQDRSKRTMFAYTWPWVTTSYAGISMNNAWDISRNHQVNFGGSLGLNHHYAKYPDFNWIFYPGASQEKNRILPSLFLSYHSDYKPIKFSLGSGYGHRAPSVSEAYGYYIYNSFDRYDYIGNPDLKNEISYEINASAEISGERFSLTAQANYFYIQNYIIGKILNLGSPMNYQSVGVKAYTSLDYATIFNLSLKARYDVLKHLHWNGILTYARGKDNQSGNLPFIRPLNYQTSLQAHLGNFGIQTSLNGDFKQRNFSPFYGEDSTPAYMIWNLSADYNWRFNQYKVTLQVGAENLLNEYYSTYADWGNIPRMGRNLFTSVKFNF